MCSASPPKRNIPPKVEAPRVQLASEDSVRARTNRRRQGRQQLRVDLNVVNPGTSLQIGQ